MSSMNLKCEHCKRQSYGQRSSISELSKWLCVDCARQDIYGIGNWQEYADKTWYWLAIVCSKRCLISFDGAYGLLEHNWLYIVDPVSGFKIRYYGRSENFQNAFRRIVEAVVGDYLPFDEAVETLKTAIAIETISRI